MYALKYEKRQIETCLEELLFYDASEDKERECNRLNEKKDKLSLQIKRLLEERKIFKTLLKEWGLSKEEKEQKEKEILKQQESFKPLLEEANDNDCGGTTSRYMHLGRYKFYHFSDN